MHGEAGVADILSLLCQLKQIAEPIIDQHIAKTRTKK